ncbi:MAG: hypothetical protein NTV58_17535 [Deltaproteobacteria bacterium]|nr:hypothetical protein [Deltaproteobacteria bacterium]
MSDFIVGSPVRDEDFWFRTDFVEDLWESLVKHNVLLLAPRRIGKTSVMYRLLDYPRDGWLVIHMNVEDLETPDDFFIALVAAINEHQPDYLRVIRSAAKGFLKGILDRIEKVEAWELKVQLRKAEASTESWRDRIEELLERVLQSDNHVLFIIDELPDMLNSIMRRQPEEYEGFLHWFRKMRDRSLRGKVRWVVGGSVNLIAALDQQGKIKLINDLKVESLAPFTPEEVREYVTTMFNEKGVPFDETTLPRIGELLGAPIPLFLQMLTQEVFRLWRRHPEMTITADTVTEVFNKALLGEMARDKLQHYRARIPLYYPPEEREAALYLLNKLSLSVEGIAPATLFSLYRKVEGKKTLRREGTALNQDYQSLLMHLRSDFYIEETRSGTYDFASLLLKTWWKKYYGFENGGD